MLRPAPAVFALALVACAVSPEVDPDRPPPLSPGAKADVYGVDDRRELYEASAAHQRLARSTAVSSPRTTTRGSRLSSSGAPLWGSTQMA